MSKTIVETVLSIFEEKGFNRNYPIGIIYTSTRGIYDTLYMSPLNELDCLCEFVENFSIKDDERNLSDNEIQKLSSWLVQETLHNKDMGKSPLRTIYFLIDDVTDSIPHKINHIFGKAKPFDEILALKVYLNTLDDFGLPNNIITNIDL